MFKGAVQASAETGAAAHDSTPASNAPTPRLIALAPPRIRTRAELGVKRHPASVVTGCSRVGVLCWGSLAVLLVGLVAPAVSAGAWTAPLTSRTQGRAPERPRSPWMPTATRP